VAEKQFSPEKSVRLSQARSKSWLCPAFPPLARPGRKTRPRGGGRVASDDDARRGGGDGGVIFSTSSKLLSGNGRPFFLFSWSFLRSSTRVLGSSRCFSAWPALRLYVKLPDNTTSQFGDVLKSVCSTHCLSGTFNNWNAYENLLSMLG
jgi:hypothetical protein